MGRLVHGINGAILGKVGTVIGSSRNGVAYIKGPHKPRTKRVSKPEKANRSKFSKAHYWLKPLLPFVREGFKNDSGRSAGFVAAKSWLLLHAFEPIGQGIAINPALVQVSYGDLPLSDGITLAESTPGTLQFTWDTDPVDGGSAYDQVMLLAYDVDNALAYYNITGQFRYSGEDVLKIPTLVRRKYQVYLAFTAADRSRQSHSVYLGEVRY